MSIVNVEALKQNGCKLWWPGQVASANAPKSISANGDAKQILPFAGAGIGIFNGTTSYLEVDDSPDFILSSTCTVEALVCIPEALIHTGYYIVGQGSAGNISWALRLENDNTFSMLYYNGGYIIDAKCSFTPTINSWYHLAYVKNGSSQYLFINGISQTLTTNTVGSFGDISGKLFVGTEYNKGANYFYKGYISELRISNVSRYTANFTPPKHQLESDSNTKLLIHFNRNDTTFIDSSPSAHTITRYGDAKQLTSPCGSGLAYFDGSGDSVTIAAHTDYNFGTGDFCVECYYYFPSHLNNRVLFLVGAYGGSSGGSISAWTDSTALLQLNIWSSDGTYYTSTNFPYSTGVWKHIAFVRYGNTLYVYHNGSLHTSWSVTGKSFNFGGNTTSIGWGLSDTYSSNQYVSEFRISNVARYTADFTPTTQPFIPDPNTKVLLHMDGVGNAFYDSSDPPGDNGFPILPDGVTVTPSGTFTTQKMKDGRNIWKFGDGTKYIVLSANDNLNLETGPYTICGWILFTSITTAVYILGRGAGGDPYFDIYYNSVGSSFIAAELTWSWTPVVNTWYHFAVVRDGTSKSLYINALQIGASQTDTYNNTLSGLYIGAQYTANCPNNGHIKDLMIFKGRALTQDQIAAIYKETYIY